MHVQTTGKPVRRIFLTFYPSTYHKIETQLKLQNCFVIKAKLLLLKLIHLFAREVLLVKKLEIEETKTTYLNSIQILKLI